MGLEKLGRFGAWNVAFDAFLEALKCQVPVLVELQVEKPEIEVGFHVCGVYAESSLVELLEIREKVFWKSLCADGGHEFDAIGDRVDRVHVLWIELYYGLVDAFCFLVLPFLEQELISSIEKLRHLAAVWRSFGLDAHSNFFEIMLLISF